MTAGHRTGAALRNRSLIKGVQAFPPQCSFFDLNCWVLQAPEFATPGRKSAVQSRRSSSLRGKAQAALRTQVPGWRWHRQLGLEDVQASKGEGGTTDGETACAKVKSRSSLLRVPGQKEEKRGRKARTLVTRPPNIAGAPAM